MMKKTAIWVALPDSLLCETTHLREKTLKLGFVGRGCAIFGVERIYIYRDLRDGSDDDRRLIKTLLEYMETPQYLRKKLFARSEELSYVGALPPLRTPHHKLKEEPHAIELGELREGVAVRVKGALYADCGLPFLVPLEGEAQEGSRVAVRFVSLHPNLRAVVVDRKDIDEYWGYRVKEAPSLAKLLKGMASSLIIFTAREGEEVQKVWGRLLARIKEARNLLIVFGSPRRGLFEILADEREEPKNFSDFVLNTIPEQKTETVRTEEALLVTLAIINILAHF